MHRIDRTPLTRRHLMTAGLAVAGAFAVPLLPAEPLAAMAPIEPITSARIVRPALFSQALAALDRHQARIANRDRIAIADFNAPSSTPRFHFVDLANGRTTTLRVAHGSGSDPDHTGWLHRFSNTDGSNASCDGAFVTADYYVGKHGQSQRLLGLDATNDNALARAIVIHSAWYANADIIATNGQLGRSQGCFAVGERDLAQVFALLGPGRMLYSAKV